VAQAKSTDMLSFEGRPSTPQTTVKRLSGFIGPLPPLKIYTLVATLLLDFIAQCIIREAFWKQFWILLAVSN